MISRNNGRIITYEYMEANEVGFFSDLDGENWLNNQRITSKIFSMLKFLLQAIAIILNVQSQANGKLITCNVCTGQGLYVNKP